MSGAWSIAKIKVTDGQLVEHILEDVNGELNLNFSAATSDGFVSFELVINSLPYSFLVQFQGEDLKYNLDSDELIFGSGVERRRYKVIMRTKRDLVLEYYDPPNFQLRKFVFVKGE
tara:strand:+ start:486 stop:833 length:348 start_codon:yes stop_codon:yes gene_type:complete